MNFSEISFSELSAISPLDGRYRSKTAPLAPYLSEYALMRYRVWVEVEYLIALYEYELSHLGTLPEDERIALKGVYRDFSEADALRIKEIERTTNHDVKAVEYFLKEKAEQAGLATVIKNKEFIHFGLTSQDINNTAIPMMLRDALVEVFMPKLLEIIDTLRENAFEWRNIPMLARTHGQAASPTTLGKEFAVFAERLARQMATLADLPVTAKFGGATGNLNAHYIAYPDKDWDAFADFFVNHSLLLYRSKPTTQIEHYDGLAAIFDCLKRINSILTDLCQDVWLYVSMDYFKQKTKAGEIGSSAMPHKVNPIDFENAEGNCGLSTAIWEFMSRKLPVSRLQRDLTDSTILRNIGVGMGYGYLSLTSLEKGLGKLVVNHNRIGADLAANSQVLAEAIQTILRRESYPNPYEALKELTRGKDGITQEVLRTWVAGLEISDAVKNELLALTPANYIGNAAAGGK